MPDLAQQIRDRLNVHAGGLLYVWPAVRTAAIIAALDLHSPVRIYHECDHQHTETEPGVIEATEIGLVCDDSYMYTICRDCCGRGESQTEECANSHSRLMCWPCPTVRAIAGALGIEVPS